MSAKMNRYWLLVSVASILATTTSGCRFGRVAAPTPIPIVLPSNLTTPSPDDQKVYVVKRGTLSKKEIYIGQVVIDRQADLSFQRSGRVAEIFVEDGDFVKAGDFIAVMDNEAYEIDLEDAHYQVEIAKENLAQAKQEIEFRRRTAQLRLELATLRMEAAQQAAGEKPDENELIQIAILKNEVAQAQVAVDSITEKVSLLLEIHLRRAELAIKKANQLITDGQLVAPFDGRVRFLKLADNELNRLYGIYAVEARIDDPSSFKIELNLPRIQIEPLYEGLPVKISASQLGGQGVDGVISALPYPFGNSPNSLVEVTLKNPQDNAKLAQGLTVAINIELKSQPDAILIPRTALRQRDQIYYVLVQEKETQREVSVGVGLIGEEMVEVVAGLETGQEVVLDK